MQVNLQETIEAGIELVRKIKALEQELEAVKAIARAEMERREVKTENVPDGSQARRVSQTKRKWDVGKILEKTPEHMLDKVAPRVPKSKICSELFGDDKNMFTETDTEYLALFPS